MQSTRTTSHSMSLIFHLNLLPSRTPFFLLCYSLIFHFLFFSRSECYHISRLVNNSLTSASERASAHTHTRARALAHRLALSHTHSNGPCRKYLISTWKNCPCEHVLCNAENPRVINTMITITGDTKITITGDTVITNTGGNKITITGDDKIAFNWLYYDHNYW